MKAKSAAKVLWCCCMVSTKGYTTNIQMLEKQYESIPHNFMKLIKMHLARWWVYSQKPNLIPQSIAKYDKAGRKPTYPVAMPFIPSIVSSIPMNVG